MLCCYFQFELFSLADRIQKRPLTSTSKQSIPTQQSQHVLRGSFELKISEWAGCGCLGLYQTLAHKKLYQTVLAHKKLYEQAVPRSHTTEPEEK
jgi:hypothetical protein